mgnify:FL=1
MFRKSVLVLALFLMSLAAASAQSVSFDSGFDEDILTLEGTVQNVRVAPGDTTVIAIKATLDPRYHIQSNAPLEEWIYPTELDVELPEGWLAGPVSYPPVEEKAFEFSPDAKMAVFGQEPVFLVSVTVPEDAKKGSQTIKAFLLFQACDDKQCLPPDEAGIDLEIEVADETSEPVESVLFAEATVGNTPTAGVGDNVFAGIVGRYGWVALGGSIFVAGLLLSLTPCVFPLIPITIGYFRNQAGASRGRTIALALTYVAGISTTYSVLGVLAASTGALFGSWLASPGFLGIIAAIIALMAFSMFGAFELRPPQFIASRSGGKAGIGGAFLMGLLFGFVAAPCTGPATVALLAFVGTLGQPLVGFILFFLLAIGISTPLLLLAIFSGNLPKSGVWMDWIKKLLGALMLGAALWLLSPVIGAQLANTIGGVMAILFGLWLGVIEKSGFKPVSLAAVRGMTAVAGVGLGLFMLVPRAETPGIVFEPYSEEAVSAAIAEGRPVMIDFTAEWCIPCHELKAGAFKDEEVLEVSERFVRLEVDVTRTTEENSQVRQQWDVRGVPTIVFLDAEGNEVLDARIQSNVPGSRLVEAMKSVEAKRSDSAQ